MEQDKVYKYWGKFLDGDGCAAGALLLSCVSI